VRRNSPHTPLPPHPRSDWIFGGDYIFLALAPPAQCAGKFTELPKLVYDNLEYNTMEYYHTSINMTKAIYSKDHKYIVEQLKRARQEAGLDQIEVAKLLGKTQSHVSKVEAGQRRIDIVALKELARIYKKPMDYFLK
jgi:DNA-binding transcriptional regulator YiaG